MLGLALGDAMGAPFEGGPLERGLWRLIGTTRQGEMRWTDDTQMSIDIAEALLAHGAVDLNDVAHRFATSYRWSRGYGPGAAKILKKIARGQAWHEANKSVYPEGSFGNGGAMRAPVLALYFLQKPDALTNSVRLITSITHAHSLGVEGAQLIAEATLQSLLHAEPLEIFAVLERTAKHAAFRERIEISRAWIQTGTLPKPREIAVKLGNGIAATTSCVTAIHIALSFAERDFEEMLSFVARCGGDVDTIGSMAGAIWGARRGKERLPARPLARLEQSERISALAKALHAACLDRSIKDQ
jgi:poly(ADP-ribose) glycohydrolase ARH3